VALKLMAGIGSDFVAGQSHAHHGKSLGRTLAGEFAALKSLAFPFTLTHARSMGNDNDGDDDSLANQLLRELFSHSLPLLLVDVVARTCVCEENERVSRSLARSHARATSLRKRGAYE